MSWKSVLKIVNFDDMARESWQDFGSKLIDVLESTGFEIKYPDHYEQTWRGSGEEKRKDPYTMRERVSSYTHMSQQEQMDEEGYGAWGHELVITDRDEPYAYGEGFASAILKIKYIEDDYSMYSNPQNEDFPHKKVTSFKIEEVSMTTGNKRKVDVKMNMENISNSLAGRRDLLQRILQAFKEYAEYEEDWGDMSEEERRTERGERAGRSHAGGAWAAGHRENVWDDER